MQALSNVFGTRSVTSNQSGMSTQTTEVCMAQFDDTPHLGLDRKTINESVFVLRHTLADVTELTIKTRNVRWNIEGPEKTDICHIADGYYALYDARCDDLARRIRVLGECAFIDVSELENDIHLRPTSKDKPHICKANLSPMEMVQWLVYDYEQAVQCVRGSVETLRSSNDFGTYDLLVTLLRDMEGSISEMRSHLKFVSRNESGEAKSLNADR